MSETKHLELFLENSCFISYTFLKIVIHVETECILIEIVSNTISLYLNDMTIVIRIQIILSLVINQNKEVRSATMSPNITERVTAFPLQSETKGDISHIIMALGGSLVKWPVPRADGLRRRKKIKWPTSKKIGQG